MQNRAAVMHGTHDVRLEDVPVPELGLKEVMEETSVPLAFIQTSEITLTGTFRYANIYPTAIDLAATGKVDLDAMVTSHYALAETEEALQASSKNPANVKPMVKLAP